MGYKSKILGIRRMARDVKSFIVSKPDGFYFSPGNAVEVSVNKPGMEDDSRPFTPVSLKSDFVLEFIIKEYKEHDGVTSKIHELKQGEELLLGDAFGEIKYNGCGVFLAGGIGITPFVAILRDLKQKGEILGNKLIYSNKTQRDIILENELKEIFSENPDDLIFILTREDLGKYENARIDKDYLKEKINDFSQKFYVCGPKKMVLETKSAFESLGAISENLIFEK